MSAYLQEQLKSINENKKELEEKYLRIQNKLELELEKNRILEMEGTIAKLKVQVNELSETIGGEIMYNNIQLIFDHSHEIFKKEMDEWQHPNLQHVDCPAVHEAKRLILREKELNLPKCNYPTRNGFWMFPDSEKLITLEKFKANLNKVDIETKNRCLNDRNGKKILVEIKPEIKIYDDILPIFRTMIGIIAKQQEEINIIKQHCKQNI